MPAESRSSGICRLSFYLKKLFYNGTGFFHLEVIVHKIAHLARNAEAAQSLVEALASAPRLSTLLCGQFGAAKLQLGLRLDCRLNVYLKPNLNLSLIQSFHDVLQIFGILRYFELFSKEVCEIPTKTR